MDTPPLGTPLEAYGREVRTLRVNSGFTLEKLSNLVRSNKSQLSRLERGQHHPSPELREALDAKLNAGGELNQVWAQAMGDGRPDWLGEVTTATRDARSVYDFQALAFPSYLQVPSYASALIRAAHPGIPDAELEDRVRERAERAESMRVARRPLLYLVLDESLLRRRYGGAEATAAQLDYVVSLADAGRVTVQVVPETLCNHPGNSGSFRVLAMPDGRDFAYVESAEQGQLLTRPHRVARHRELYSQLQAVARAPEDSVAALRAELDKVRV